MATIRSATTLGLLTLSLAGCVTRTGAPTGGSLISTSDARAYLVGRRREIDLTAAALAMLPCARSAEARTVIAAGAAPDHIEPDAAARAGLSLVTYRRLVAHVDSLLREDSNSLDVSTRGLDSLRVDLTVLRTRISAEQAQPITTSRREACVAH